MKISFGTKIILQDKIKHNRELNKKFSDPDYKKKINVPMSDAWAEIETLPRMDKVYPKTVRNKMPRSNDIKSGKYQIASQPVYGTTRSVDICTAGVVLGNNGDVAMFHIAPTIENYDILTCSAGWKKDHLGASIDKFEKASGGIKSAIIVGGKENNSTRAELSKKTNNLIKDKFVQRNIPLTTLSGLKFSNCDLFYSSKDDTLKIGVAGLGELVRDSFSEVNLQGEDDIEVKG